MAKNNPMQTRSMWENIKQPQEEPPVVRLCQSVPSAADSSVASFPGVDGPSYGKRRADYRLEPNRPEGVYGGAKCWVSVSPGNRPLPTVTATLSRQPCSALPSVVVNVPDSIDRLDETDGRTLQRRGVEGSCS
ncbi:casein kinase I [Anopheles sinensis]|uniref:Casein kinase I n=1 Tax=Anopheles sinensis TaxID=74873 RepID=A0A084VXG3_ANOSI|nr:casein kinase I [Anopheles sinensis]